LRDDPGVFDQALADANLELAGLLASVTQMNVLHIRIDQVELGLLVWTLEAMTGIDREAQPGNGFAELERDLRIAGKLSRVRQQSRNKAVPHGGVHQRRESLDLLFQRRSERRGRHGENGDTERLGEPAVRIEPAAHGLVVPVNRAEVEMDRGRREARPSANLLQRGLEVVAHLGWAKVLAILDDRQLELVKLQFGDQAKGLLQRLPRKAECAASDEHRPPSSPTLFSSPWGYLDQGRKRSCSTSQIRTAGENSILLTPWADLTAPCDQAKGQKPRLGPTARTPTSLIVPRDGFAG